MSFKKNLIHYFSAKNTIKLIIAFIGFYYASDLIIPDKPIGIDFWSYYYAGKVFINNGNIYDISALKSFCPEEAKYKVYPYLYPPVLAMAISPISYFPPPLAQKIWTFFLCICIAFVCVSGINFTENYFKRSDKSIDLQFKKFHFYLFAILVIILLNILPFRNNIEVGQVNILVLFFLMAALVYYIREKSFLCGLFLSLSIIIKVTPAILVLYFLFRKKYRIIGVAGICSALIFVISFIADGGKSWINFFSFLPKMGYGASLEGLFSQAQIGVFSLASLFARISNENQLLVKLLSYCSILLFLVIIVLSYYKSKKPELCILPLLILMIIASPFTYLHHLIFIFPGLIIFVSVIYLELPQRKNYIHITGLFFLTIIACINFPKWYFILSGNYLFSSFTQNAYYSLNLYFLIILFFYCIFLMNKYFSIPKEPKKQLN